MLKSISIPIILRRVGKKSAYLGSSQGASFYRGGIQRHNTDDQDPNDLVRNEVIRGLL